MKALIAVSPHRRIGEWGLRDYGFEQIFGGDKDCEHEWGSSQVEHDALRYRGHHSNVGNNRNPEIHPGKEGSGGKYCSCGAWKGQLGLEPTPEMYIEHLAEIFNEAKRVLKKEGTLWLNMGDSYMGSNQGYGQHGPPTTGFQDVKKGFYAAGEFKRTPLSFKHPTVKAKCLCMIPERLAWSLIQNGWILRNKIIWYKPNAMPSSVKDRFSNRWEHIFLFSKSKKYYFDLDAVREPHIEYEVERRKKEYLKGLNSKYKTKAEEAVGGLGSTSAIKNVRKRQEIYLFSAGKNPGDIFKVGAETRTMGAIIGSGGGVKVPGGKGWTGHPPGGEHRIKHDPRWCPPEGKNPGDFLEINTQPFPEAHFAVFPEKLCEKPIKAGCPEQVCRKCGKARERIIELGKVVQTFGSDKGKTAKSDHYGDDAGNRKRIFAKKMIARQHETIGWTSCKCNAGFKGGIILDPFAGAGTVGIVAKKLGMRFILIDIKKEYCDMAKKRIAQVGHQMELRA